MRVEEGKGRERRVDWGWGFGDEGSMHHDASSFQCDYNGLFIPKSEG